MMLSHFIYIDANQDHLVRNISSGSFYQDHPKLRTGITINQDSGKAAYGPDS